METSAKNSGLAVGP